MSAFPDVSPEAPSPYPVKVGVEGTPHPSKGIFIAHPSSFPPHPHLPLCSMEVGAEGHRTSLGLPPLQGLKATYISIWNVGLLGTSYSQSIPSEQRPIWTSCEESPCAFS